MSINKSFIPSLIVALLLISLVGSAVADTPCQPTGKVLSLETEDSDAVLYIRIADNPVSYELFGPGNLKVEARAHLKDEAVNAELSITGLPEGGIRNLDFVSGTDIYADGRDGKPSAPIVFTLEVPAGKHDVTLSASSELMVLLSSAPDYISDKLDLNRASYEAVAALPISEELAIAIVDFRTYVHYFSSIYEVMEVPGMTNDDLKVLMPLVATLPPDALDASIARLSASYRQVQRYMSQEGASEGLADEYLDMMRNPKNINKLDFFDLTSFQNVSAVDAKNILNARKRLGRFDSARQLRRSDGLRYWSFRNIRDFVTYDDSAQKEDGKVHGNYEVRYYDSPYMSDNDEISSQTELTAGNPHMVHKLNLEMGPKVRGGLLSYRAMGEKSWNETQKAYYGFNDQKFGPLNIKRLYMGNFRVAFGQGLIMDNTDYIHFRKTGFGWNKRPNGVRGDLSRSHQYALSGVAVEANIGRVHATLFSSANDRDAIMNPDGTINRYLMMEPRPEQEVLEARMTGAPRDAFREEMIGGNFKIMLGEASYIGLTGYESKYDEAFNPRVETLIMSDNMDLLQARDSELWSGYNSIEITYENAEPDTIKHKFRRVYGAEFQATINNVAFAGEYAQLQDPKRSAFGGINHGDHHDAYLLNAFAQWDNLHLLAIYRDYDVGFDNPYNRAFSNDSRYEQTLLTAPYRLEDDLYSWLALNDPTPKAEKGIFLEARYRITRQLILNGIQFDQWQRKADGTDMRRYTIKAEYQPKFNIRLRTRHRYSSRSMMTATDVRWFSSWESRWELITLLSNYNRLKFMYSTSNVMFPPRPRLSYTPYPGNPDVWGDSSSAVGTAGIPSHAFQVLYEHNLTDGIKFMASSQLYNGFLWNFEGNEFVMVDGKGFRNWLKIISRVSPRMLMQVKVTRDHNMPSTYIDARNFGDEYGDSPESTYAPRDFTTFRVQMDYTF
ncbi:hypothetical protein HOD41_08415 [bacterium]|nr:hypothetical protein [bacterium]